ncbi:right-handed parallel beta-helix repeat-containing protein [Agrilutibacter solisilvae]|uniref:Right-handed parallel beta-helix repeat-containing protein n=1 Tax=Agrilutibacter solisilvae TaxID=2763317 RepID=A0A974XZY7_9GAMM|nr:right-handed parallel beta-helix repeat-containing protein [Lysobacter solisilvae]QSX78876.1 right-handed parallel beta-helix repeat-containing protein [Lysobacter solisilvae]
MIRPSHVAATIALAALACTALPTRAADSYDSCEGRFIQSLPVTITSQGVWCLRHDLSTAIGAGAAVTIATNNVTLNCNGYKLGGLAAGDTSQATGVYASNRQNVTVRGCNLRGFNHGIWIDGGGGHVVADNRLDNALLVGIRVSGEHNRVIDNAVFDTGGATERTEAYGIIASADVIGNTVAGVFATAANTYLHGMLVNGDGHQVRGNVIRGLAPAGFGAAHGIVATGSGMTIEGNRVSSATLIGGNGIAGHGAADTFCLDNTVARFAGGITQCRPSSTNDSFL